MPELEVGSEFAGHLIQGVAGRGGMGVVYHATDLALDRAVALKVIAPEFAEDVTFRERFKRESKLAASIKHPNVITVYRAGEEDGRLYVTMDYVSGTDLRELIAGEGRLAPRVAADVVSQVAAGLDAAHARGLVHRDVKPANVLLSSGEGGHHVYLTDFGLTKQTASQSGMTATGMVVGTLDYIAPEQLEGGMLDARSDVYSLGCVLYQALTGQVPYPRDSDPAKMFAHLGTPPPSVLEHASDVAPEFDEVVRRAMAKDPDDRYLSAGDLGRAALAAAQGQVLSRAERSVATGGAAPQDASAVPGAPSTVMAGGAVSPEAGDDDLTEAARTRAAAAGPQSPAATKAAGAQRASSAPALPRNRTPALIAVAGVIALVLVVVGGIVLLGGDDSESESQSSSGQAAGGQQASETSALLGTYAGRVKQFGPGQQTSKYGVIVELNDLTVGSEGGRIFYPRFDCGGPLSISKAGADSAVLRERLTRGASRCYGGGARIDITRKRQNITFRWTGESKKGTPVETLGTLKPTTE